MHSINRPVLFIIQWKFKDIIEKTNPIMNLVNCYIVPISKFSLYIVSMFQIVYNIINIKIQSRFTL